jgi:hypothetical protein
MELTMRPAEAFVQPVLDGGCDDSNIVGQASRLSPSAFDI